MPADTTTNRINARFRQDADFDYITLRLRLRGTWITTSPAGEEFRRGAPGHRVRDRADLSVYMTSVWCPFPDFIHFLEAMAVQVQECGFRWDPEGPDAAMQWSRRYINGDGCLTVSWQGYGGKHHVSVALRAQLNTRQAVAALYTAFRRFVESPAYDPLRYERLNFSETLPFVLTGTTLDELAAVLVELDAQAAEQLLLAIVDVVGERRAGQPGLRYTLDHYRRSAATREITPNELGHWMDPAWNGWSTAERLADVHNVIFRGGVGSWYGSKLRELRSPVIEQWLSTPMKSPAT